MFTEEEHHLLFGILKQLQHGWRCADILIYVDVELFRVLGVGRSAWQIRGCL